MDYDEGNGRSNRPGEHRPQSRGEDFESRIRALLSYHGCELEEVCSQVGLRRDSVESAMRQGVNGLPGTQEVLQRLLAYFDQDLLWLIEGPPVPRSSPKERAISLRQLVWDFILSDERFPWQHRIPLLDHVEAMARQRPASTMGMAARKAPPRTILDVAFIYESLKKQWLSNEEK